MHCSSVNIYIFVFSVSYGASGALNNDNSAFSFIFSPGVGDILTPCGCKIDILKKYPKEFRTFCLGNNDPYNLRKCH